MFVRILANATEFTINEMAEDRMTEEQANSYLLHIVNTFKFMAL